MLGLPAPSACSGCVDIAVSKAASRRLLVTRRLAAGDLKMDVTINQNKIIDSGEAPVTAIVVQERQATVQFSSTRTTGTATYSPPTSQAVAGNGVCEVGENSSNSQGDCLERLTCPGGGNCGGFGICIAVTGQCNCFDGQGHAGNDCSTCKPGFLKDRSTQQCKVQVALLPSGPPGVDWALSAGVLGGATSCSRNAGSLLRRRAKPRSRPPPSRRFRTFPFHASEAGMTWDCVARGYHAVYNRVVSSGQSQRSRRVPLILHDTCTCIQVRCTMFMY